MLHHEGISEEMFKRASLSDSLLELEDSELQNEVTHMLKYLGKRDSGWSSWDFLQVVKSLGSYSLIERDHQNCTYRVHPLVQHWSGTTMGKNRHVVGKCVVSIIGLSIPLTFHDEDYKYRRALYKHITNYRALVNPAEMNSLVASSLGLIYSEQGRWKDAEVLDVVVMEKRKQLLGEDHPNTLTSMSNLASTYRNQGRWKDAEVLEVVVMEKRKQLLGEDHPHTLTIMANLASTYRSQGRWKGRRVGRGGRDGKAEAAAGRRSSLTPSQACPILRRTYRNQGRWKDAELLDVVVMEKRKWLLGEDHPRHLSSMANLAVYIQESGPLEGCRGSLRWS
jgi:hypothetical protein